MASSWIEKSRDWLAEKIAVRPMLDAEVVTDTKTSIQVATFMGDVLDNPDPVLKNNIENKGWELYQEMGYKDLKISSALKTRKAGVLSKPWHVEAGSDAPEDVEWAEMLEYEILRKMPRFDKKRKQMLSAIQYGFSVMEAIWMYDEKTGLVRPADLKEKDQQYFGFKIDTHDLLFRPAAEFTFQSLPAYKFLVTTFEEERDNPYGTPIMRNVYWYYFFKRIGVKFWAMSIEKWANPTAILKHPNTIKDKTIRDAIKEQIKALRNWGTEIVMPKSYELELKEAVHQAGGSQEKFARYIDALIAQEVLGQTLTSDVADSGAYSAGKVHDEVRQDYIEDDAKMLQSTMDVLLQWLTMFNKGDVQYFPTFKIEYEPEGDRKLEAEILDFAINKLGMSVNEEEAYNKLQLKPPSDDKDEKRIEPNQTQPFNPMAQQPEDQDDDKKKQTKSRPSGKKDDKEIGKGKKVQEKGKDEFGDPIKMVLLSEAIPPSGNLAAEPMPWEGKVYRTAQIATIQEPFRKKIADLFDDLWPELQRTLTAGYDNRAAMEILISDMLRDKYENVLRGHITVANRQVLETAVNSMAKQLDVAVSKQNFEFLTKQFIEDHFYAFGTDDRVMMMRQTLTNDLMREIDVMFREDIGIDDFVKRMQDVWQGTLSPRKIDMITKTETRSAANWAVLQIGKQSPLELEAWFLVDPASCDICQSWAAGSPYTIKQAENLGTLPHPNCNDQWVLVYKKDAGKQPVRDDVEKTEKPKPKARPAPEVPEFKTLKAFEKWIYAKGIAKEVKYAGGGRGFGTKMRKADALVKANAVAREIEDYEKRLNIKLPAVDELYITKNRRGMAGWIGGEDVFHKIAFADEWSDDVWERQRRWDKITGKKWNWLKEEGHVPFNVRHEFAHIMDYQNGITNTAGYRLLRYNLKQEGFDVAKRISDYATTNPREFFAEAMAEYTSKYYGKVRPRFPKILEDWLEAQLDLFRKEG